MKGLRGVAAVMSSHVLVVFVVACYLCGSLVKMASPSPKRDDKMFHARFVIARRAIPSAMH